LLGIEESEGGEEGRRKGSIVGKEKAKNVLGRSHFSKYDHDSRSQGRERKRRLRRRDRETND